ncbi:MAG: sugar phosphate isomerase/epimerase family protein [Bacillota bacterium]
MYKSLGPGAIGVDVSLEKAAELAAEYDFAGLQVNVNLLKEKGVAEVKKIYEKYDLKPGSFGLPVNIYASEEDFEKELSELPEKAQMAKELGCSRSSTYIFSFSDERDYKENFQYHVERINPAAEILENNNIRLGLEFLGPLTLREGHDYEFIHTIEGMLELTSAVKTDNMGLLLDAYHWYTAGEDINSLKSLKNKDIVDVHVNDAPAGVPVSEQKDGVRRLPAETGVIKLDVFMSHLKEIDYDGPVMTEPFSNEVNEMEPEEAVKVTSEAMDKIWEFIS